MNLHRSHLDNSGSVLLFIVVASFVVVVFSIAVYNIIKAAKRCDGGSYRSGMYTNDESIIIPNDKYDTNFVCWLQDSRSWFEWDDTIPTGSGFVAAADASSVSPSPMQSGPVVLSSLNSTGGVVIRICSDEEAPMKRSTYRDIGMEVDLDGMPDFCAMGESPFVAESVWELQRSTNLVDWDTAVSQEMRSGVTNAFRDTPPPNPYQIYYRMMRP